MPLHVIGDIRIEDTAANVPGLLLKDTTNGVDWDVRVQDRNFHLYETGIGARLTIEEGGNVGIGNTN
jgi:hypothetical protein